MTPQTYKNAARTGRRFRLQTKCLAEFAPAGAKKFFVFSGGVYVAENTYRGASVELSASGGQPRRRAERILLVGKPDRVCRRFEIPSKMTGFS